MKTHFRIIASYPPENFTGVFESRGLYEKLWQFSSDLVKKGFAVTDVTTIEQTKPSSDKIILCEVK